MTETGKPGIDSGDFELLLPWYITGRLDAAEAKSVEAYLAEHPQARLQLDLAREELDVVTHANQAITAPSATALDRLMQEIDTTTQAGRASARPRLIIAGLLGAIEAFLGSITPRRLAIGTLAAAALIVVQAGLIGGLVLQGRQPGSTYSTASGGKQQGAHVLVRFKLGVELSAVTAYLERHDAQIVSGPTAGSVFKLRVGDKPLDKAERAELMQRLGADLNVVEMVLPSQ